MFDSPKIQAAKAAAAIVEFDKHLAVLKDNSLDRQVLRMMLEFDVDLKFGKSIRKSTDASPKPETQSQTVEQAEAEPEDISDEPLTGEERLRQAKESVKGLLR